MTARIGARHRARQLRLRRRVGRERHRPFRRIAWLRGQPRPIDRAPVEARRRACFQPALRQAKLADLAGQGRCGLTALPATGPALIAAKQRCAEECPGGDHDRDTYECRSIGKQHAADRATIEAEGDRLALDNGHAALVD